MPRKPRIGIASALEYPDPERPVFKSKTLLFVDRALCRWVEAGGGVPLLFPTATGEQLEETLGLFDGIVLGVGSDVAPGSYGEQAVVPEWEGDPERDAYEIEVIQIAMQKRIPLFGICRGIQILNVALGGTLFQDLPTMRADGIVHRQHEPYERYLHGIEVVEGTRLAEIVGGGRIGDVNSVHHQGIKDLADGLVVEARCAEDGLVEAVRLDDPSRFVAAVQWHPEWAHPDDASHLDGTPILADFLAAARGWRD